MWKENERLQMAEENRRILEFANQQETREKDRMAVRKAEEEAKDSVRNKLAKQLAEQNQEADELQQYVHFLLTCMLHYLHIYTIYIFTQLNTTHMSYLRNIVMLLID